MKNSKKTVFAIALALSAAAGLEARAQSMKITNTYGDKEVWITTYKEGGQAQSFCVGKSGSATKSHPWYNRGFKIRAEVMTGPACKGTKICDTDIDLLGEGAPGYMNPASGLYVHQHAVVRDKCYISWSPKQEHHKMVVKNTYKNRYVWVTSYDYMTGAFAARKQIHSGCVNPGTERSWSDDRYQNGNYVIRAEVMTEPNCKGSKECDTDANPLYQNSAKPNFVRQNAQDPKKCFIDWK